MKCVHAMCKVCCRVKCRTERLDCAGMIVIHCTCVLIGLITITTENVYHLISSTKLVSLMKGTIAVHTNFQVDQKHSILSGDERSSRG